MIEKALTLHTSNRIERLARRLVEVASEVPLSSALSQETVMTLNPGIARWLQFEIAKRTGVSFGWNFPLPGRLFNHLLQGFEPDFERVGAFPESVATWRLADLLSKLEDKPSFSQVRAYCQSSNTARRFAFASRLTRLFDEYLVYRPDTIIEWEDGAPGYDWQAELWRRLMRTLFPNQRKPRHIARIWRELSRGEVLELGMQPQFWPERLFVFGVSSLAPLYLDILDTISRHLPVHVFLLQPSDLYWADLKTSKQMRKIAKRAARPRGGPERLFNPEDWLFETGNPLLPAFGKQSQMFLDLLIDRDPIQDDSSFEPPEPLSQLTTLQADLFLLENRDTKRGSYPFPEYDDTLQIHSCSGRRREVETVWDFIVNRLDRSPTLRPSQILVMAPNIQDYRSHIEAVFQAKRGTPLEIPFTIADASAASRSSTLSGLAALFENASTRASAPDTLALLETPLLREAFKFSDLDLERIEFWIRELGITWGWDAAHRQQHHGFSTDRNTWKELRIRLSAGLAFSSEIATPSGFLAYPELGGDLSDTAGRLLECLDLLQSLRTLYRQTHSLDFWKTRMLALVEQLRTKVEERQGDYQKAVELVSEALPPLADTDASGAEVFRALIDSVESNTSGGGYLSGGVTFCSLKPMRAIPVDTVCLIGMNRVDFPRRSNRLSFDMLAKQTRIGDRNTREEDRQLFLETLLSARSHLFISYLGSAQNSDTPKEPSVVLEELIAYLRQAMTPEDFQSLRRVQRRQSFDPVYFGEAGFFSYDPDRASQFNHFHAKQAPAPKAPTPPQFSREPVTDLDIGELIRFLRDPCKAFATSAAKLRFVDAEEPLPSSDPLQVGGLDRFELRQAFADAIASGERLENLQSGPFAQRKLLPPGLQEDASFLAEKERALALAEVLSGTDFSTRPGRIQIDETSLTGMVRIDQKSASQILAHGGELTAPRIVDAWIRHLFALCAVPEFAGETQVFTLHEKEKHLSFRDVADARGELARLLCLYRRGLQAPLPLFPILAQACYTAWKKERSEDLELKRSAALATAQRELSKAKEESPFPRQFTWSDFHQACFGDTLEPDDAFVELAISFWQPIDTASEPLAAPSSVEP